MLRAWFTRGFSSSRIVRLLIVAAASVAQSPSALGQTPAPGASFDAPIVIENVRIVTGTGTTIDEGAILIERERIVAVGADVRAPAGAESLDGSGMTAYPGFIDCNTHAGVAFEDATDEERQRVEDESPDVRDGPQSATVGAYRRLIHPHRRAIDRIDVASRPISDLRQAGFTAALLSPPTAILSGVSAVVLLGDAPLRRQVLLPEFAQHAALVTRYGSAPAGGGFRGRPAGGRPGGFGYPGTTMGAMALFRQVMLDSIWQDSLSAWAQRHPGDGPRVPRDENLDAIARIRAGGLPVVWLANTENEIHRALDLSRDFGLRPVICGGREAWRVIDRLEREKPPLIVSLRFDDEPRKYKRPKKPSTQPDDAEDKPLFDADWQDRPYEPKRAVDERRRLWEEQVDNCLRLHQAGIPFVLGSFDQESGAKLLGNLRKAVERGLPEAEAVAALTSRAAEFLGLSGQIGSIAPGRIANVTILTRPLSDKKAKARWVFIDGRKYEYDVESRDRKENEKQDEGEQSGRGRRRGGDSDDAEEGHDDAASQPASKPSSDDGEVEYPEWPVEIESDRHIAFQTGGNVLLRNATLLTITNGRMDQADLLVRDGKIAAIGPGLAAPDGVATVDLTGYVVCPGIIDAHSHMATDGGLNEGTLSVTPEVRVLDVIDHRDTALYRALAGGVTTIHTMHGSANSIGGQNAVLKLRYGRSAEQLKFEGATRTVKWALGENVSQKNSGTSRGSRFPNSRMGVVATIRRSLDAARKYADEHKAFREAAARGEDPRPLRRDLRLEALASVLDGDIWVNCHCYRSDEILQLLLTAETYGFRIAVLQHVLEGYKLVPELHRHGCGASTFSDWWAYKLEAYDAVPHNAARMVQGGVVATLNSDSAEEVRHLNLEAAKMIGYTGIDETAALRMVTLNAAIQFGIDGRVGSLDVGKDADLAVFNGHPLDTFARCVMTLVDGEAYFVDREFDPAAPTPPSRAIMTFDSTDVKSPPPVLSASTYVLRGATVHPVSGPAVADGTVVIHDDVISYVGPAGGFDASSVAQATTLDLSGLHVYPGFIDAASGLGLTEIGQVPASVDTAEIGRFQPDLLASWAIHPHSSHLDVARAGGITAALVMPRGGVAAGQASLVNLAGWTVTEMLVRDGVALCVGLPSLPPDLPDERRPQTIKDHVKEIREIERYFARARQYADLLDAAERDPGRTPPDRDSRWDAMIPYVRREKPVVFNANDYKQIREALAFAERVAVRPIINGGRDAWKLADRLAADEVPVIVHGTTTYPERSFGTYDSSYRNPALLDQAGVLFCIASNESSNARELGVEAGMAVAYGLDPQRAVYACTLAPARILGIDDTHGSVETGKVADLIVTTGHPCQASSRVVYEFIRGRPANLENRQTRLDAKFRGRPAPDLPPAPTLSGPAPMRLSK